MHRGHNTTKAYAYDFDRATGSITNRRLFAEKQTKYPEYMEYLDIAFSPNDSLFYMTFTAPPLNSAVIQYRRFAPDIGNTADTIRLTSPFSTFSTFTGGIQVGPNGKIYVQHQWPREMDNGSERYYLSIIHKPNEVGLSCRPQPYGFEYDSVISDAWLVTSLPYARHPGFVRFSWQPQCGSVHLANKSDSIFTAFTWFFAGEDSVITTGKEPVDFSFKKPGKYYVRLKGVTPWDYAAWYSDTITIPATPVINTAYADSVVCAGAAFRVQATACPPGYRSQKEQWQWMFENEWINGTPGMEHVFEKPGNYPVYLVYQNEFVSDTVKAGDIRVLPAPLAGFTVDAPRGCAPHTVHITPGMGNDSAQYLYTFADGYATTEKEPVFTYEKPGLHWIVQTVKYPNGCAHTDSLQVRVYPSATKEIILYASVVSDNAIIIAWPAKTGILTHVWRSASGAEYEHIGASTDSFLIDRTVNAQERAYYYQIQQADSCANTGDRSEPAKTVFLSGVDQEGTVQLSWNQYEGWQQGIKEYRIDTGTGINAGIPVPGTQTSFTDTDFGNTSKYEQCYRVIAVSQSDSHNYFSAGNTVCIKKLPVLWVPNTFSPNEDGHNDSFLCIGVGMAEYRMQVYDRWGQLIFSAESIHTGWDGKTKGLPVPEGLYLYSIQARFR
ncbi:MAG: gliding motility-associated C-terminal domain-containing protein, partial [Bacteroidota bacterium]|nr:gliding motility-associated C-terminal domain-containing protein [Bacteroidota bacterium]